MRIRLLLLLIVITSSSALCQTVTVMTYNIRFDNPTDGINAWPNRKAKVIRLIKKYDPDILGVQEALLHQLEDITKGLPQYTFVGVGRDDGKTKGEYSAILFKKKKFALLVQNTFWLSETPEVPGSKDWDAAITRIATWCKLRDNKTQQEFLVMNSHFDHIGKEARKKSASILKARAAELAQNLPVIITGDFNCIRDEEPYTIIMDRAVLALADPAPADPPGTFCSFIVNSMECNPIDYILHSLHWDASGYEVIMDNDGKHYPSDHVPVVVTLKK